MSLGGGAATSLQWAMLFSANPPLPCRLPIRSGKGGNLRSLATWQATLTWWAMGIWKRCPWHLDNRPGSRESTHTHAHTPTSEFLYCLHFQPGFDSTEWVVSFLSLWIKVSAPSPRTPHGVPEWSMNNSHLDAGKTWMQGWEMEGEPVYSMQVKKHRRAQTQPEILLCTV